MIDAAGWRLGGGCYCLGGGEAELGGPALDVGPEPVALVQVVPLATSARIIAVMAVLRSRAWPGSQETSQSLRPGACRAEWAVLSLVMVVC
jgi:hypothetical protein